MLNFLHYLPVDFVCFDAKLNTKLKEKEKSTAMTSNDVLNKMTRIYPDQGIFIRVRDTTISFSKAAFELLGKPEGIEIYCCDGKVAVQPGWDFMFSKTKPGQQDIHRICGTRMIEMVKEHVGDGRVLGKIEDGILFFTKETEEN